MFASYLVISILSGMTVFAVGDTIGAGERNPAVFALLAAVLWPVLVVGLAQLVVVMTARRLASDRRLERELSRL